MIVRAVAEVLRHEGKVVLAGPVGEGAGAMVVYEAPSEEDALPIAGLLAPWPGRVDVRVVLEDGVHAFSVATVAARAGISHRTVYRHFPTKEALLGAFWAWLQAQARRQGYGGVFTRSDR